MQTQKKFFLHRISSYSRYFAYRPSRANVSLRWRYTRRTRLKSTFPLYITFHPWKLTECCRSCIALVATLHWMRYLVGIILFFPMVREKHEARDRYSSMSRGFPQDRQLFYHHKRRYRVKNLYPTRTNVCARAIVAWGWLKSSGKPLNENPYDATSRLWAGN